jgi:N-acyl-D-amino-acid deacylase
MQDFAPRGIPDKFDLLIRGGVVYDGTGREGVSADVGIAGTMVLAIGDLSGSTAVRTIDSTGLCVAPGFINMLSWSAESLLVDGRSESEIRQGVTTQIFGEGTSMGPLNQEMKERLIAQQADIKYDITWSSLAEYLDTLEKRGISQNVASLVGASTVRQHILGLGNIAPTELQMDAMRRLVAEEMKAGALGLGSSLIYAPSMFATTEELIELCKVVAKYDGIYMTHMRSEGDRLEEALEETIYITRQAEVRTEIYHLKAAGQRNWKKIDQLLSRVNTVRSEGLPIGANMYLYTAAGTALAEACIPRWALEGGFDSFLERVANPDQRLLIANAVRDPQPEWENFYQLVPSADSIRLVEFKSEALKSYTGFTLSDIAIARRGDPVETMLDLVLEDRSPIGAVFFLMSEENLRKQLRQPWMAIGSDASSRAAEGVFLKSFTHPRAYGNFARLLGKYVREERVISLAEAVYRLSGLPAKNLRLQQRGYIAPGMFADIVVFDPEKIRDTATYESPHQYAVGVRHVLVNGTVVLDNGEHTGAKPGRILRPNRHLACDT